MIYASHAHPTEELEDYLFGHVTAERAVAIEVHLIGCSPCRGELEETRTYIADMRAALALWNESSPVAFCHETSERRGAPRMSCDTRVVVSYRTHGRMTHFPGRLVNTSVRGGGLLLPNALPVNASAHIHIRGGEFTGTVRYCRRDADGFHAGVQLADGCRWVR